MPDTMPEKDQIYALHLFSDRKILPWIKQTFLRSGWDSAYIIVNRKARNQQKNLDQQTWEVSGDQHGINFILEKSGPVQFIFYHLLDNFKGELAIRMPKTKIQCWCFYGTEVYQQTPIFRKRLYGPVTSKVLWLFPEIRFRFELRALYYKFLRRERTPLKTFKLAIQKIDFILWYIEKEINFIQKYIPLPPFLFFQHFQLNDVLPPSESYVDTDEKKILIGNSATIENNHFDIIAVLEKLELSDYEITIPLTYGQFRRYKQKVKRSFLNSVKGTITFMEDHLPIEVYYETLKKHKTAIFLHRRQQGLGNIFYLIYIGTKVYLSGESIIYEWLRENNIDVFCFEEDFVQDFQGHQLTLSAEQGLKNRQLLRKLLDQTPNELTFTLFEEMIQLQREENGIRKSEGP